MWNGISDFTSLPLVARNVRARGCGGCVANGGSLHWRRVGVDAERGGEVLHYIWYVLDVHASGSKFRSSSPFG